MREKASADTNADGGGRQPFARNRWRQETSLEDGLATRPVRSGECQPRLLERSSDNRDRRSTRPSIIASRGGRRGAAAPAWGVPDPLRADESWLLNLRTPGQHAIS